MAILNASTPATYVVILIDLARRRGVAAADLLAGTPLSEASLATMGMRVNDEHFTTIVANAYAMTGDQALGLHLGQRLNLSAHATVGQAFMTCENLAQVLTFFLKYYHILAPGMDLKYRQHAGRCWLTAHLPAADRVAFRYELFFAAFAYNLGLLLNKQDFGYRLELPYAEPDYVAEYYPLFGNNLYFDSEVARISLPEHWLKALLPSSNPALLTLYEQECQRLLADLEENDSLTEQTVQLLRKLAGHYPQMPQVAAMFNYGPRTYRRRLAAEGSSFQQLLDQVRTEHATHCLKNTRLPLVSIAFMVGFSDISNFRRAYIKWTGHSPGETRRSA